jgi:hypothetical protein
VALQIFFLRLSVTTTNNDDEAIFQQVHSQQHNLWKNSPLLSVLHSLTDFKNADNIEFHSIKQQQSRGGERNEGKWKIDGSECIDLLGIYQFKANGMALNVN